MRIGIAGAGFAGLGAAYHLRHHDVTVFDPKGVGGGASGVSAGLLHPFTGNSGKMNDRGREAMEETRKLLCASEAALGESVCDRSGILRRPTDDKQKKLFAKMAHAYDGLHWDGTVLHMVNGITVYPKKYLQGLLKASGAEFVEAPFSGEFDRVIWAVGASVEEDLPIQFVKGQLLRFEGKLEKSVLGNGYMAQTEDPNVYSFGATFEHHYDDDAPDMPLAKLLLREKWSGGSFKPIGCDAGVRVVNKKGQFPIIHQKDTKTWVLTGFGVRGLLYHALASKELAALLS